MGLPGRNKFRMTDSWGITDCRFASVHPLAGISVTLNFAVRQLPDGDFSVGVLRTGFLDAEPSSWHGHPFGSMTDSWENDMNMKTAFLSGLIMSN